VMLCRQGMVKILDFGIAHMLGEADHRAGGSPPYMAPEQWRGQVQDTRTDVFGAAAMLFESLSGRLPYRTNRGWSSALEPGARPDVDGAGLDRDVGQLLLRALSPDPEARPRDGHDWLVALLQVRERRDARGLLRRPIDRKARR
jgi:serine/threonine protein kinase